MTPEPAVWQLAAVFCAWYAVAVLWTRWLDADARPDDPPMWFTWLLSPLVVSTTAAVWVWDGYYRHVVAGPKSRREAKPCPKTRSSSTSAAGGS